MQLLPKNSFSILHIGLRSLMEITRHSISFQEFTSSILILLGMNILSMLHIELPIIYVILIDLYTYMERYQKCQSPHVSHTRGKKQVIQGKGFPQMCILMKKKCSVVLLSVTRHKSVCGQCSLPFTCSEFVRIDISDKQNLERSFFCSRKFPVFARHALL
jgi:hypothetical protein